MFERLKKKKSILFTTAISLLCCCVAGVSTFAWFQLEQQPLQTSVVSGTPNITIDQNNIYSNKIQHELSTTTGFVNYASDTVSRQKTQENRSTTHHHQDDDRSLPA